MLKMLRKEPEINQNLPKPIALCFTLILLVVSFGLMAQPPQMKLQLNLKSYIEQFSEEAVKQMVEFKIPASVILAQAIFESGSGTSDLAKKSNNHFGIKCHADWCCDTIVKTDDTLNECFRKYMTVEESYRDHSLFLLNRPRYAELFQIPINDYTSWCYGIKNAGYATYPTYAEDLINLIEKEKLYELDRTVYLRQHKIAIAKAPPEIRTSPLTVSHLGLRDFLKNGVLWLDPKDILFQSLDMIVGSDDQQDEGLAEN